MILVSAQTITQIFYMFTWLFLAFVYFRILRTIKLERLFPQGKVAEIRISYFLAILILSFVTTEALFKFISLFQFN